MKQFKHGSISDHGFTDWYQTKMTEARDSEFSTSVLANRLNHEGYSLTVKAMQRFWEFLSRKEVTHNPSIDERLGLLDLARAIEASARNYDIAPIQLSKLACGVGKTTMIKFMLIEIMNNEELKNAGVVICLNREKAIESLVNELTLENEDLLNHIGVFTKNPEMSTIRDGLVSRARAHDAPILITTQQLVTSNNPNKEPIYFYKRRARAVKIWDEQWMLGEVYELTFEHVRSILPALSDKYKFNVEFKNELDKLEDLLYRGKATEGSLVVFDFQSYFASIVDALGPVKNKDIKRSIQALWNLSNLPAMCTKKGKGGQTVCIQYKQTIPAKMFPLVITDASGGVRHVYPLTNDNKYEVCTRYQAERDYSAVTFHHWNIGGGHNKFKDLSEVEHRAKEFAKVLLADDKESLIFHFKPVNENTNDEIDSVKVLKDLIGNDERFKFLQYGYHTSTNEFKDVKRIYLYGTINPSEAFTDGSTELHSSPNASKEDKHKMKVGEFLSEFMQSVMRGNARNSDNGISSTCEIYFMLHTKQGYLDDLQKLFKGAEFKKWEVEQKVSKKSLLYKSTVLLTQLMDTYGEDLDGFKVPISELIETLRTTRRHFTRVRNDERFKAFLQDNLLAQVGSDGDPKASRKYSIEYDCLF